MINAFARADVTGYIVDRDSRTGLNFALVRVGRAPST